MPEGLVIRISFCCLKKVDQSYFAHHGSHLARVIFSRVLEMVQGIFLFPHFQKVVPHI